VEKPFLPDNTNSNIRLPPQNLNNFNLPGLNRNFCASQMVDNQTYASACRPVIYSAIREFVGPKRFRSYVSL
jgi:hypothetical protein